MVTPPSTEDVIEAVHLTKLFKNFWGQPKAKAVNDLNFTVKSGQVFGLLGPNGAGKSTVVKMLLGLLYPTRGTLRVLGESPRKVSVKKDIGYLPEESYYYHYLTAQETINFFGALFGLPLQERQRRTQQLIEMLGLTQARNRAVGEFSKGMLRRIGLAQALINDPRLVILDEPTAGLDPIGCNEVKDVIKLMAQRGKTVILSSHLLADVEDVCDNVLVLYGGRVHAQGNINELLRKNDKTLIETPALNDDDKQRLMELLQSMFSSEDLSIQQPSMKLEEYFLDVVQQARVSQTETAGVQAGGEIPDYLKAGVEDEEAYQYSRQEEKLQRLTSSEEEPSAEERSEEETTEESKEDLQAKEQKLSQLTSEQKEQEKEEEEEETEAEEESAEEKEDKLQDIITKRKR